MVVGKDTIIQAEFSHSRAVEADATTDQTNQLATCPQKNSP